MPKPNKTRLIRAALRLSPRWAPYALLSPFVTLFAVFGVFPLAFSLYLALAVVARVTGGPMPCGACRQLLSEYAPAATVWVADSARPKSCREFSVKELLPGAFLSLSHVSV